MTQSDDRSQPGFARSPEASPGPPAEAREAPRFPMAAAVRVGWVDARRQVTYTTARGLDISESGLALSLPAPLSPSTIVHLELAGCGMSAVGHVRSCSPMGDAWRAGIEMTATFPSDAPAPSTGACAERKPE